MKRLLLSSLLLLSSFFASATAPTTTDLNTASSIRASILQTDIAPFIQAEDCNQQVQSVSDVLVTTESELDAANSEIQSLIDHCSISACESLLDETRTQFSVTESVLESTQEELVEAQSDIVSLQDELSECDFVVDQATDLINDPSIPNASSIDALISSLFNYSSTFIDSPLSDPLVELINNGLIPYLQAALAKLGELSPIKQIAAGAYHTVVLTTNGKVYATGWNNYGQLGIGEVPAEDPGYRTTLTAMIGEDSSGITAIAAGYYHTVALKDSGALYATGRNNYGQLGIGVRSLDPENPNYSRHTLTAMIGEDSSGVIAITAGQYHTVALKDSGALYATGRNNYGQLGIGDTIYTSTNVLTAMTGEGTSGVTAIAAGINHTIALKDSGALSTGYNYYGQLGIGTSGAGEDTNVLTAMIETGTSGITAIAAGGNYTIALKDSGNLYATGQNNNGQLGIGDVPAEDPGFRTTLTAMTGEGTSGITAIAAGTYHTVALKDSGALYATGYNNTGQLGIGDTIYTSTNVLTAMIDLGTSGITAIAAGGSYTVALKDSGALYATGYNFYGQLGIEDKIDKNKLTEIASEYRSVLYNF